MAAKTKRGRVKMDDGCAGCLTARKDRPCLAHGCTKWCGKHLASFLTPESQEKVYGVATCRSCNQPLQREQRSRHKVWYVCTNLYCSKNQKEAVLLGGVVIGNKPKGRKVR